MADDRVKGLYAEWIEAEEDTQWWWDCLIRFVDSIAIAQRRIYEFNFSRLEKRGDQVFDDEWSERDLRGVWIGKLGQDIWVKDSQKS